MLIIGIIHILLYFILIIYALFAPYRYDRYLFLLIILFPISWTLLDGECIISYLCKKHKNTNYCIGENKFDYPDMDEAWAFFEKKVGTKNTNFLKKMADTKIVILFIIYRFYLMKTIQPSYSLGFFLLFFYYSSKFRNKEITNEERLQFKQFSCFYFLFMLIIVLKDKTNHFIN